MHEIHSRLKAIMFVLVTETADDDRESPVSSDRLSEIKKDLRDHFKRFRGDLLELGTGEIYAYFSGAVSAFNAAIRLQQLMPQFNLRIGLHLGEVICREGKVQGRDVNFASRLPYCARAGGICLSQSVYQYLEQPEKQILVALGPHCLKNIDGKVALYAYLPAGQSCRSKFREFKRLFIESLQKCRRYVWSSLLAGAVAIIVFPIYMDNSLPVRKVVKLYVPAFEIHTDGSHHNGLPESIEVVVRSLISGKHEYYDLHLLNNRSSALIELLVTIKQLPGRIQAGYVINSLPEGGTLAYGGFEEDEERVFYIQDRLSDQILSALRQHLIQHPSLASGSVKAKLGYIGAGR